MLEQLIIVQPDSGEQALGILEVFVKSNVIDLIVVDSVAALTQHHKLKLDGEMSDQTIWVLKRD
ncbi:hypothetical protein [Spiroplasma endosymbiont of Agriotes lineatus]|uniref:hypothetical protein n=1 Tax=Spiroplasma endosymbiont of Agriotes lineatus TaxID=3077930 RepID=UPI003BB19BE8